MSSGLNSEVTVIPLIYANNTSIPEFEIQKTLINDESVYRIDGVRVKKMHDKGVYVTRDAKILK